MKDDRFDISYSGHTETNRDLKNLNNAKIPDADGPPESLKNFSTDSGNFSVYFRDIKDILISHINKAEIIFGAVAWFTDFDIIEALSKKQVQIVVQKEDFLRVDLDLNYPQTGWALKLRRAYENLSFEFSKFELNYPVRCMNVCGDAVEDVAPVRCVGNHNNDKFKSSPRMHNKFLVFAKAEIKQYSFYREVEMKPYALWTGSYNFSYAAGNSFENATYLKNPIITTAYYREYLQILALSQSLNWETEWCAPEWRIGT